MKRKNIIIGLLILVIVLGFIVPGYIYSDINSLPVDAQYPIKTTINETFERNLVVGYKLMDEGIDDSGIVNYHIRAYTIFGLTWADIYSTIDKENDTGSGSVDRTIFP